MKNKYIESCLRALVEPNVRVRGRKIYDSDGILGAYVDINDSYIFDVVGTSEDFYTVKVMNPESVDIESSCACKYAEDGSICKHQVAALLYLENGDEVKNVCESRNKLFKHKSDKAGLLDDLPDGDCRLSSEDLIIKDFVPVSDKLVEDIAFEGCSDIYKYTFLNYSHTQLSYRVSDLYNTRNSYYGKNYINETIKITSLSDGSIGVVCSCGKKVPNGKACEHVYGLFVNFSSGDSKDFLKFLVKDADKRVIEDISKKFSLPVEIVKEHIGYNIQESGLNIFAKEGSEGLIIGNRWEDSVFRDFKTNIDSAKNVENFIPVGVEEDVRGFSIVFNFLEKSRIEVFPLTAKLNKAKTAFSSSFKMHDGSFGDNVFPYEYSEQYPELFRLLELFNIQKDRGFRENSNVGNVFIMLRRVFELSKNLPYKVYYLSSYSKKISTRNLFSVLLSDDRVCVKFKLRKDEFVYVLNTILEIGDKEIVLDIDNVDDYLVNRYLVKYNGALHLFKDIKHQNILTSFVERPQLMFPHKDYNRLQTEVILPLMENFEIDLSEVENFQESNDLSKITAKRVYLSEKDGKVLFLPKLVYDDNVELDLLSNVSCVSRDDKFVRVERNSDYEDGFVDFLEGLHPNFKDQRDLGLYFLAFKDMMKKHWFLDAFEEMREKDISIFGLSELEKFKYSTHKANVSANISSGTDWFDVDITVSFGNYSLSIADLKKIAKSGERYVELGNGSIGILPKEWLEKIQKMFRFSDSFDKNGLKISKLKFSLIDELFEDVDDAAIIEELAAKRKKLLSFQEISSVNVPKEIKADLRPYQKEGLNWLNFLDENKWGGILADDMGLGKTIQVLTFIQTLVNENSKSTSLVVLPTTLIFNWENEINKFTKGIKFCFHTGFNRQRSVERFKNFNIIITSYGVLMNDIDFIKDFKFNYAILDESQAIKNPNSKRYKAAMLIKADNRLALTGTPIENNTFDLYAQMNFVNPGFLGSQNMFKEDYSLPIDRDKNEICANDLHKLIRPFILRRTKEQVATDLPPKIEDVLYCEMESEQLKVYEAFRNKYRDYLMGKFEEEGLAKSKLYVLEGLTKLRQICDSPSLLSGDEVYTDESVKIKTLINHIEERTNKHKILVFSQFVKMLTLVKDELSSRNISFEYLDGKCSGKQRKLSVDNFQNDDNVRVFLISLKAGGTGLNLTAADYVYLLDPWWNPAVENQAIDRAYRIGQDKKVIAYRMITKNSIEEKIMGIQGKKKKIASDIIQTDEGVFKDLSKDDILELFG